MPTLLPVEGGDETARTVGWSREQWAKLTSVDAEDEHEALFDRGWTDGLPVVPPTPERMLPMLRGPPRDPAEVVAVVPPDLVGCTVEKVAVNAVLAGCSPEHLPVVLAALEAASAEESALHGLVATTCSPHPWWSSTGRSRRGSG